MYKYRDNITCFTGKTAATKDRFTLSTNCVSKNVLEVPMKLYREYKVKRNLEIKAYVGLLAPFLPIKLLWMWGMTPVNNSKVLDSILTFA